MTTVEADYVIVGAGIGGSLLSLLLGRRGHRVVLVEAAAGPSSRGADFLKPRGIRILDEQGLLPDLLDRGAVRRDIIDYYHDGALVLSYPFAEHTDLGYFLIVPYPETVGAILTACAELPNVDVRFSSAIATIEVEEPTVTAAVLRDGTRLRARAFVDTTSSSSPLYAFVAPQRDVTTYDHVMRMATVPITASISTRNRLYFSSDGWLTYFYPIDAQRARVFVGLPRQLEEPVFEQRSIDLRSRLDGFVTDSADALPLLDAGQFTAAPITSVTCKPYHHGNVVLLGGAVFSPHPMTGQGMSYTMEDATVLAEVLSDADGSDHLAQLLDQRYEARRRVHTALVEYGNGLAGSFHDRSAYLDSHRSMMHGGDR